MMNPAMMLCYYLIKNFVDQSLIAQLDYLIEENRILRSKVKTPKLSNMERISLAKLGKRLRDLNYSIFKQTIGIVTPDTILRWHRDLIKKKWDYSKKVKKPGPKRKIVGEVADLVLKIAHECKGGYKEIAGRMDGLGIHLSPITIRTFLRGQGYIPGGARHFNMSWKEFLDRHASLVWNSDFFTVEVWHGCQLITYHVLVFIHYQTRELWIAPPTMNPDADWMVQQARNFIYDRQDIPGKKYLVMDNDQLYFDQYKDTIRSGGFEIKHVTAPQMNGRAERVIQNIQNQCTENFIFIGFDMLYKALKQYEKFYNFERNHQGIGNIPPGPRAQPVRKEGKVMRKERLGGLLKYYYRDAA